MINKISVIGGAGKVGSTFAFLAAYMVLAKEIILLDIFKDVVEGRADDICQAVIDVNPNVHIKGTTDYNDIKSSDIVVITAGKPRKEGMKRIDLAKENSIIVVEACKNIKRYTPDSKVIVITNPVDVMTYIAAAVLGLEFSPSRIMGQGGFLDSLRFSYFIKEELGSNYLGQKIDAMVIGNHEEEYMIPLVRTAQIDGKFLDNYFADEQIKKISDKTKMGGTIILEKSGPTYFAPAYAIFKMVNAIVNDTGEMMSCSAYMIEEDVFIGVPVKLGKGGIKLEPKRIEDLSLEYNLKPEDLIKFKDGIRNTKITLSEIGYKGKYSVTRFS